jgi:hypothetical protein
VRSPNVPALRQVESFPHCGHFIQKVHLGPKYKGSRYQAVTDAHRLSTGFVPRILSHCGIPCGVRAAERFQCVGSLPPGPGNPDWVWGGRLAGTASPIRHPTRRVARPLLLGPARSERAPRSPMVEAACRVAYTGSLIPIHGASPFPSCGATFSRSFEITQGRPENQFLESTSLVAAGLADEFLKSNGVDGAAFLDFDQCGAEVSHKDQWSLLQ